MPKPIVVTGDCLRPYRDGSLDGSNVQTRWLHRLVERQVVLATGVAPKLLILDPDRGIDAHAFYRTHGLTDRLNAWAGLYDGRRLHAEVTALYEPHVRGAVVIGFEMPPYLRSALSGLGVPFVDVWVHPIRFLDDLLLGVRSSDPASDAAIRGHAVCEDEVWMTAGLRRATVMTSPYSVLDPDTTLFLAQARMDKSQVFDGRFVDAGAFDDDLRRLAAEPGPWLLKPHPYDPDHPLTARVRELVPRARTVTDNVYHLFAQDEVTRVVSLNSSAAIEARYFGKQVTLLIPPVIEVGYRGGTGNPYWSLDHRVLDPDFWRQALAPLVPTTSPDGFRHAPKPNRLRIALHSFWGFQQIDTDAFVHIARPPGGDTGHVPIPSAVGQSANLLPVLHLLHPAECDRVGRFVWLPGREEPRIEVYGPYATLPAGRYRLTIRSYVAAGASFFADVCFDYSNSYLLPRAEIPAGAWEGEFEVAEATTGVETRLWSGRAEVRIDAIVIECLRLGPVPPPAETP